MVYHDLGNVPLENNHSSSKWTTEEMRAKEKEKKKKKPISSRDTPCITFACFMFFRSSSSAFFTILIYDFSFFLFGHLRVSFFLAGISEDTRSIDGGIQRRGFLWIWLVSLTLWSRERKGNFLFFFFAGGRKDEWMDGWIVRRLGTEKSVAGQGV